MLTIGREAVEKVDNAYYAFDAVAGGIAGLVASWVADGHAADVQQLAPINDRAAVAAAFAAAAAVDA